MNDYIAKPVDEKLLYQKIVGLFRKTELEKLKEAQLSETKENKSFKYIDMTYLNQRTKSNPKLIIEMISLYLEQTPGLIALMRNSFEQGDWSSLHAAAHKMIPSFSIMGISSDFENIARKVQEYASMQQKADGIHDMILNLEQVCLEACQELEEELNRIKKINV
jgi:HPt (histidine-containing phosphotransfer) domain-containing protein